VTPVSDSLQLFLKGKVTHDLCFVSGCLHSGGGGGGLDICLVVRKFYNLAF
jgi:hypothetical protein